MTMKLRELMAKATSGPWTSEHICTEDCCPHMWTVVSESTSDKYKNKRGVVTTGFEHGDDARLIAALRNAAPDLLRIAEAVAAMDISDHYAGDVICLMCGQRARGVEQDEPLHTPDCAYVLARRIVEGTGR